MKDLRHVSLLAVILLVVLRMAIGWQFLYEGLWKVSTLSTSTPWTSEGYLKNAAGPLRNHFREMTGDPDDLKWLDYADMSRRWYDWRDRFVQHYGLNPDQAAELNRLLDGSATEDTSPEDLPPAMNLRVTLAELPPSVDPRKLTGALQYDADKKQLVATAPILPSEEAAALQMVDVALASDGKSYVRADAPETPADPVEVAFYKGVGSLVRSSRQLSFRHQLAAALRGDPETVGVTGERNPRGSFDIVMGTTTAKEQGAERDNIRYGKIQEYKDLVRDYNAALDQAAMSYQYDHATMLGRKLAGLRAEVVGPIRALDKTLRDDALALVSAQQRTHGVLPPAETPLHRNDQLVILGLLGLGVLLIIGLFSRLAAVLGAVMVLMFYLVMPPWPGIPPVPGPEHSLIVNKNLIEAFALLGIAALPTGKWFGIDGLIARLFCGRKSCQKSPSGR